MGQSGKLAAAVLLMFCGCRTADAQPIFRVADASHPDILLIQADTAEITFWNSVKDTANPEELKAYLEAFPDGTFAPLAKIRLQSLTGNRDAKQAEAKGEAEGRKEADPDKANAAAATPAKNEKPASREKLVTVTLGSWRNYPVRAGYLGASVTATPAPGTDSLTPSIPAGAAMVTSTEAGEPAETAGIVAGNIILAIDGKPVGDRNSLVKTLRQYGPGDRIKVKVHQLAETKDGALAALRERAAQNGDRGFSSFALAQIIQSGDPDNQDMRGALEMYERAADQGNISSMARLGVIYLRGEGVAKDAGKARVLFEEAVDAGNADAMVYLGLMYERGNGVGEDHKAAFGLYQRAADAGNRYGIRNLADLYSDGNGVAKDPKKAAELYRRAAEMGVVGAMTDLAIMYQRGTGVIEDPVRAADWYNKAAYLGSSYAMFALAGMYDKGLGLKRSPQLAARHLLEAFKAGYFRSRDALFEHQSRWSEETRKFVQRYLKAVGTYTGVIDGELGLSSRKALLAFEETGIILLPALKQEKPTTEKTPAAAPEDDLGDLSTLD